jgi:hypothetical protein
VWRGRDSTPEEGEFRSLKRMYATLSGINQAIIHARTKEELFDEACRVAVERGGFRLAWIGVLVGDRLRPVCAYGGGAERIGELKVSAPVRKGRIAVNPFSATVPVELDGRVIGALTLHSSEPGFFTEDEVELLEQLGKDISFGLEHIQMLEELRARMERFKKYGEVLLELSKMEFTTLEEVLERIMRLDSESMGVERVSVWLFNSDRSEIICRCMYRRSEKTFEEGQVLRAEDYPSYFRALEENRIIAAEHAVTDPRTSEFADSYLKPHGIVSMMDVPVRLQGRLVGVVCHEHTARKAWTPEEQEFAVSIADMVSMALEHAERRRAEERIMELSQFPAKNPNPIFKVSKGGEIVYHNPAVLNYISHPEEVEELLPMNFRELVRSACETGSRIRVEHKFGSRSIDYIIFPVSRETAHIYGREITEIKKAEEKLKKYAEELEKSQRALLSILEDEREARKKLEEAYQELKTLDQLKSDIIANVSHELRTPMTIAKGFAELALEEASEAERRRELMMVIKALENQNAIIGNLITMAEASRERLKLRASQFSIRDLISQAVEKKIDEISSRGLKIEVSVEDFTLVGDFKKLLHALINLLDNAIKFNRPKGKITVKARRGKESLVISVSDTGIGIPREVMPKIFDPLFQADASARRKYGGTGMGLAVAKIIVEAHGGEIYASSIPSEGSTFTVVLPLRRGAWG